MALNSIAVEFERFWAMIVKGMKPAPSENQKAEMRKAFFAGAWMMQKGTEEIGEPHISEAQGMQWLTDRRDECQAFSRQLLREYSERN